MYNIAGGEKREVCWQWLVVGFGVLLAFSVGNLIAAEKKPEGMFLHVKVVDFHETNIEKRLGLDAILPASPHQKVALPRLVNYLLDPGSVSVVRSCQIKISNGEESIYEDMKPIQYIDRSPSGDLAVRNTEKLEGFRFKVVPIRQKDGYILIRFSFELNNVGVRMKVKGIESLPIGKPLWDSVAEKGSIPVLPGEDYIASAFYSGSDSRGKYQLVLLRIDDGNRSLKAGVK